MGANEKGLSVSRNAETQSDAQKIVWRLALVNDILVGSGASEILTKCERISQRSSLKSSRVEAHMGIPVRLVSYGYRCLNSDKV